MKKLIIILLLAASANAALSGFTNDSRKLDLIQASNQDIANTLHRIEKLLDRLVQANAVPVEAAIAATKAAEAKAQADNYIQELQSQSNYTPHKLIFEEDKSVSDTQEACIKECADIYETTDKFELRDCLIEMCGFELSDILK